jgi:aryl-alcohol dehydrogenase-like predicted oxidoreductase
MILCAKGKSFTVGVSDAAAGRIAKANTPPAVRGWSPFVALQIEYSLVERTPDFEVFLMPRKQLPNADNMALIFADCSTTDLFVQAQRLSPKCP